MKICTKCKRELSLDNFYNLTKSVDGKAATCKECAKAFQKDYYKSNSDRVKTRVARYAANNREIVLERHRSYYLEHLENFREYQRRPDVMERNRIHCKSQYRKHRDERLAQQKEYAKRPEVQARRREYIKQWDTSETGRSCKRRMIREYREKYPERYKANNAVAVAVRNGSMVKPDVCEYCHEQKRLNGHHYLGYEQEHWLHVQWLCHKCHRIAEQNSRQTQ
jgi:hypothetical protein